MKRDDADSFPPTSGNVKPRTVAVTIEYPLELPDPYQDWAPIRQTVTRIWRNNYGIGCAWRFDYTRQPPRHYAVLTGTHLDHPPP